MNFKNLFARKPAHRPTAPGKSSSADNPNDDRLALLTDIYSDRLSESRSSRSAPPRCCFMRLVAVVVAVLTLALLLAAWRGWLSPEPDLARGLEYFEQGDYVRAIHVFARLLRECESDLAARFHLGAAYHNYGWHDEALNQYAKTLGLAGFYSTRAAHSAGRIHAMRGEYDLALDYFNLALQFDPQSPEISTEREAVLAILETDAAQIDHPPESLPE